MNDILLNADDDLQILNGDLVIGESYMQEVGTVLRLNQADLKRDPLLGPNLVRLVNSNVDQEEMETAIRISLARDGKDYNEVKDYITLKRNG